MDEDQEISDENNTADADTGDTPPVDATDDSATQDGEGDDDRYLRLKQKTDDIKNRADREKRRRQEQTRRAEEAERRLAEYERKQMQDKERWQELIASHEQEREQERAALQARNEKLQSLFREKQSTDLKKAVFEEAGIKHSFLADAAFDAVLKDLPVIEDVDPEDLESLKLPSVDPQAVKAVSRRIRKVAPELFNLDSSGKGGDPPSANPKRRGRTSIVDGAVLREGYDPNDPAVQAVLRMARGQ